MPAIAATRSAHATDYSSRILAVIVFAAAVMTALTASAQSRAKKEEPKLREVTLKTKDGLPLRAFYFPSDKGKEAVPVLIVHEWQGQASPYGKLVLALHQAGCAVLVPDYRGHGNSKEYTDQRGATKEFNIAQMSRRDIENIVKYDLEAAKAFLKEENNAGKLNLNAMTVIGVREGCVLAARWAHTDWMWPSIGRIKQGQDVKGLVFISPEKQIKGIGVDPVLAPTSPLLRLPVLIIAGEGSEEAEEAERIAKRIEALKKRFGRGEAEGFELLTPATTLSGAPLVLNESAVIPKITSFITDEIAAAKDANPWIERE